MKMFMTEKELVAAFTDKAQSFLGIVRRKPVSRYFLIPEFDSYFGVADLLVGTYKPYLSKKNNRQCINTNWLIPLVDFKLNQIITNELLSTKYNLSRNSASQRLYDYVEAGFLSQIDKENYKVTREYEFITDEIIAIEAKLKNWKKALSQATRYKRFSDYSFVLLDSTYASSALKNIELFRLQNIGLITLDNDQLTVHHLPAAKNIKKDEYLPRINETVYKQFSMLSQVV